jgi:hypothetical protein
VSYSEASAKFFLLQRFVHRFLVGEMKRTQLGTGPAGKERSQFCLEVSHEQVEDLVLHTSLGISLCQLSDWVRRRADRPMCATLECRLCGVETDGDCLQTGAAMSDLVLYTPFVPE